MVMHPAIIHATVGMIPEENMQLTHQLAHHKISIIIIIRTEGDR